MTPREQFDALWQKAIESGELVLKTIAHNGQEIPALRLLYQNGQWKIEEIVAMKDGEISRDTRIISQARAESFVWAYLRPTQSNEEENPDA